MKESAAAEGMTIGRELILCTEYVWKVHYWAEAILDILLFNSHS